MKELGEDIARAAARMADDIALRSIPGEDEHFTEWSSEALRRRVKTQAYNVIIESILLGIAAMAVLVCLLATPAQAETDVWLFYGAGPHFFSTGIDTIARWARHTRGVTSVHVSDYRDTQAAYDFLRAQPSSHHIVIAGYSCGSNASLVVGGSLSRQVTLAILQPSIWCGRYGATGNMQLLQNTYSYGTWGLGAYTPDGPAQRIINIDRRNAHLRGDNDRDSQRDVLAVVTATANPDRRHWWFWNRLHRTTTFDHRRGNTTWLEGVE